MFGRIERRKYELQYSEDSLALDMKLDRSNVNRIANCHSYLRLDDIPTVDQNLGEPLILRELADIEGYDIVPKQPVRHTGHGLWRDVDDVDHAMDDIARRVREAMHEAGIGGTPDRAVLEATLDEIPKLRRLLNALEAGLQHELRRPGRAA